MMHALKRLLQFMCVEGSGEGQVAAIRRLPRKLLQFQAGDDGSLKHTYYGRDAEK